MQISAQETCIDIPGKFLPVFLVGMSTKVMAQIHIKSSQDLPTVSEEVPL